MGVGSIMQFSPNIYGTKDLEKSFPEFLKGPNYDILMAYSLLRVHPSTHSRRKFFLPWPTGDFSAMQAKKTST
jgi:hypothetical protein